MIITKQDSQAERKFIRVMKLPLLSLKEKTQDNEFEQKHHVVCNLHCVRIFICDDRLRSLDINPVLDCWCANSDYDSYGVECGGCNCNGRSIGG